MSNLCKVDNCNKTNNKYQVKPSYNELKNVLSEVKDVNKIFSLVEQFVSSLKETKGVNFFSKLNTASDFLELKEASTKKDWKRAREILDQIEGGFLGEGAGALVAALGASTFAAPSITAVVICGAIGALIGSEYYDDLKAFISKKDPALKEAIDKVEKFLLIDSLSALNKGSAQIINYANKHLKQADIELSNFTEATSKLIEVKTKDFKENAKEALDNTEKFLNEGARKVFKQMDDAVLYLNKGASDVFDFVGRKIISLGK